MTGPVAPATPSAAPEPASSAAAGSSPGSGAASRVVAALASIFPPSHTHYLRAAVVGLLVGTLAVSFQWSLALADEGRGALLHRLRALPHANAWAWSILPILGLIVGGAVGWMVARFAPEAKGSGIPNFKGVLLHIREMRWWRLIPVKFLGGVLGIGAGLSMGREGPTVQMGGAVGAAVGRFLRVPSRTMPQLMSCGAGAGLAAAFNAPLAGFIFVIEELHREMSALTYGGALIAAVAADIVARSLNGQLPSFSVQVTHALPLSALPAVAALGLVAGAVGSLFNRGILVSLDLSWKIRRIPRWMFPGIAAGLCGLLAWWIPDAVGGGHEVAQRLLAGKLSLTIPAMCGLLVIRLLMTGVSYGSGAPGGVFAPMLLVGALLGSIVAKVAVMLSPGLGDSADAFAVLGMGAMFVGAVRAPLTGIVLLLEMTGNYEQLLSLCVACVAAHLVSDALRTLPIYDALLEEDIRRNGLGPGRGPGVPTSAPRTVVMGVQRDSALEGKPIRAAGIPAGCLVVGVERGGKELLPRADLVLVAGDHISVLTPDNEPEKAMAVVDLARAR